LISIRMDPETSLIVFQGKGMRRVWHDNENQPLGAILGLKAEVLRSSPKRLIFGIKNCAINGGVSHPAQFLMTKE